MGTALQAVTGSIADAQRKQGTSLARALLAVEAVVLVDMSDSMNTRDAGEGRARVDVARSEVQKLQGRLPGRIALVTFASDAQWRRDGHIGQASGSTNLSGALEYVEQLLGPGAGRVKVVVVSDGEPDDGPRALGAAKALVGRGATISTVFCGSDYGDGKEFLRRLAAASGGQSDEAFAAKLLEQKIAGLLTA